VTLVVIAGLEDEQHLLHGLTHVGHVLGPAQLSSPAAAAPGTERLTQRAGKKS
jgi:hypothetical protein